MSSVEDVALRLQWSNPGDILSLLLLIGGDIVQKALAQFVGVRFQPFKNGLSIPITPVAFSFGWVAYAFNSLVATVGDNSLMPDPDCPALVINCSNGYIRDNHSWVLGRLLRDTETKNEVDKSKISLRIDIFVAKEPTLSPEIDTAWILGWVVILVQQVIAVIPWILYDDWPIFMVTVCGTFGALLSSSLSQWHSEKWPNTKLRKGKTKTVCLTRGNGHSHVIVIIGENKGWDLEAFSTATGSRRRETRFICASLTLFWTLLLITVSGIKTNTWFLIGVGGLGMLQNVYAAGTSRSPAAFNIPLERYKPCPYILGYREPHLAKNLDDTDSNEEATDVPDVKLTAPDGKFKGVMGALMALEKKIPKAGASLLDVFFPGGMEYEGKKFKYNRDKKFWKKAFRNIDAEKLVEGKPRSSKSTSKKKSTVTVDTAQVPVNHNGD
jgi:hypothetical protein